MAVVANPDEDRATAKDPRGGLRTVPSVPGNGASTGASSTLGTLTASQCQQWQQPTRVRTGKMQTGDEAEGEAQVRTDGLRRVVGSVSQESQCHGKQWGPQPCRHAAAGHRSSQMSEFNGKVTILLKTGTRGVQFCIVFHFEHLSLFPNFSIMNMNCLCNKKFFFCCFQFQKMAKTKQKMVFACLNRKI